MIGRNRLTSKSWLIKNARVPHRSRSVAFRLIVIKNMNNRKNNRPHGFEIFTKFSSIHNPTYTPTNLTRPDPPNVRDRRLNSASEYIRVFYSDTPKQAVSKPGCKTAPKNNLRTLTLGEDSMTDIKKDKTLSEKSETKVAGPDAGRRRIIKGAGAVTAASALSVPMILALPRANAATELNMIFGMGTQGIHGEGSSHTRQDQSEILRRRRQHARPDLSVTSRHLRSGSV